MNKVILLFLIISIMSCESQTPKKDDTKDTKQVQTINIPKQYQPTVIRKFSHDSLAFTQGLTIHKGILYESTGQLGASSIRKVDLKTGEVILKKDIPFKYFGEGSTVFDEKLYFFTWQNNIGWRYSLDELNQLDAFTYDSEGWGMTDTKDRIIISDGTSILRYKDPKTFNTIETKEIFWNGRPLHYINEIEYVDGIIYANIWMKDAIAVIDEKASNVIAMVELGFLRNQLDGSQLAEVLNGIAYNKETDTFIITGKNWPYYFEIKLN